MKKTFLILLIVSIFASITVAEEMPGTLSVGNKVIDFEAKNVHGDKVVLSEYYSNGKVMLVFYRGGWCMFCNIQLQEIEEYIEDLKALDITVVAISVDLPAKALETKTDKNLSFDIIAGLQTEILDKYGLINKIPDNTAKMYKEKYHIDLESASGKTDHVIAIPATYVVDQSGIVIYAYADEDYKSRPKTPDIINELINE